MPICNMHIELKGMDGHMDELSANVWSTEVNVDLLYHFSKLDNWPVPSDISDLVLSPTWIVRFMDGGDGWAQYTIHTVKGNTHHGLPSRNTQQILMTRRFGVLECHHPICLATQYSSSYQCLGPRSRHRKKVDEPDKECERHLDWKIACATQLLGWGCKIVIL